MRNDLGARARALGFHIRSVIDDVHTLPYPDNSFDIVTLQFASRLGFERGGRDGDTVTVVRKL